MNSLGIKVCRRYQCCQLWAFLLGLVTLFGVAQAVPTIVARRDVANLYGRIRVTTASSVSPAADAWAVFAEYAMPIAPIVGPLVAASHPLQCAMSPDPDLQELLASSASNNPIVVAPANFSATCTPYQLARQLRKAGAAALISIPQDSFQSYARVLQRTATEVELPVWTDFAHVSVTGPDGANLWRLALSGANARPTASFHPSGVASSVAPATTEDGSATDALPHNGFAFHAALILAILALLTVVCVITVFIAKRRRYYFSNWNQAEQGTVHRQRALLIRHAMAVICHSDRVRTLPASLDEKPASDLGPIPLSSRPPASPASSTAPASPSLLTPLSPALTSMLTRAPDTKSDDSGSTECVICIDDLGPHCLELPCTHRFHKDCILTWLTDHYTCPLCKFHLLLNRPASLLARLSDTTLHELTILVAREVVLSGDANLPIRNVDAVIDFLQVDDGEAEPDVLHQSRQDNSSALTPSSGADTVSSRSSTRPAPPTGQLQHALASVDGGQLFPPTSLLGRARAGASAVHTEVLLDARTRELEWDDNELPSQQGATASVIC
ncbi:uncharacterized protein MONBRDRAFT_36524 [Monosiga brevicollis MX1]|uniref:RING-type domain-containing protein n=1 Tax=Monosiga brevicollis TaxID=81824 RepID=A9UVT2_MONBE|nr:uncharacterized protein MONBRDRAFT_36524 [Monosiga brevicollis MX1]EDQ90446.1 predicted protein [Monosiga brevicollis MX1]|eukprot:XP_001744497.1 hypothetical protein [Monosiga brevicollis MX1]